MSKARHGLCVALQVSMVGHRNRSARLRYYRFSVQPKDLVCRHHVPPVRRMLMVIEAARLGGVGCFDE